MSFNKAKSLKAASKYVQQGKYEAAIEEYRRIVQTDPHDVTTFNTLGDLYVKAGHSSEAIRCFMHVAENYRLNGFNLKAIAMLKKVSKIDSANIEIGLKLAALYTQQKLIVDARNQYLSVAEHYLREGQAQKALDIYQRVADLDPENTSIQIKLAEAYLREGQPEQAYEAFIAAAGELRRQHKEEEALEIYLRSLSANPRGQIALSAVINLYIQRNDIPNAISLIEKLLQERPNDAELLILLSRVHQSRNDLEKAESAIARAFASDPARYQYVIDLAVLFLNRGDVEGALRQFDRIAEKLFDYREEEKGVLLLREVLSQDAHHFGALERLANLYSRTHEDHLLIETLNTLAEAAIHQGRSQTAVSALGQLLQLEPDEIQHRRRLRVLGLSDEEVQGLTSGTSSAPYSSDQQEITREIKVFTTSSHLEAVSAESLNAAPQESVSSSDENISPAISDFSSYNPDSAITLSANNDDNIDLSPSAYEVENKSSEFVSEIQDHSDYRNGYKVSNIQSPDQNLTQAYPGNDESAETLNISDEIESIEFYIAQGMLDVARYTLNTLEQQFPKHPEVAAARTQLEAAELANGSETTAINDQVNLSQIDLSGGVQRDHQSISTEPVKWFNHDAPSEFTEAESQAIFILPSQPPIVGIGQVIESLPSTEPNSIQASNTDFPEVAQPFELLDGPEEGELLSLLDEFKAEVVPKNHVEDFDTHYNLGLAYKDMEMFDEAVEEFQQAFKAIMADPAGQNYLLCCSMLGFCFTQKNLPRLAVMWFKRGLESPGHTEDEYQALRFDLAQAYASLGEMQQAYDLFSEVYGIDVNYRSVKTKLHEIEQQMAQA